MANNSTAEREAELHGKWQREKQRAKRQKPLSDAAPPLSQTLAGQNANNQETAEREKEAEIRPRVGLRETARILKQAKKLAREKKKKEQEETAEITTKPTRLLSARFLSMSWLGLIESFGLTIIYINFHFMMAHMLKNKYFCKFGGEWLGGGKNPFGQVGANWLGPFEILLLFIVDSMILLILLFLILLIILMIEYLSNLSNIIPIDFFIKTIGDLVTRFL